MTLLELQSLDPDVGHSGGGKHRPVHSRLSVTLCAGSKSELSVTLCSAV